MISQFSTFDTNANKIIQKLLHKIIMWKFSRNLRDELEKRRISHAEISRVAGRVENAFNKTINRVEDLRMSSFIRYWVSIEQIIREKQKEYNVLNAGLNFSDLLDEEIHKIAIITSDLSRERLSDLIILEDSFILSLKPYVYELREIPGALSQEEITIFEYICTKTC